MDGVKFDESRMDESGQSVCVLLVEDEGLIAEMISLALEDRGYRVCISDNADDALRLLSSDEPIDILFTDINLPGNMDGAVLAVKAREIRPDLPVIFASGRWSLLDKLQTIPHSAILPKPYSVTRACEAVKRLLDGARPAASLTF
jgi:DNA-binding response OmpR family regulator